MNARKLKLTVIALSAAAAFGGAYSYGRWLPIDEAGAATLTAPAPLPPIAAPTALPDMRTIVERQGAAVVNISVTGSRRVANVPGLRGIDPDDPFYQFFRRFGVPPGGGEAPVRSQGSGFIVSADGIVLTNAHVVDGADEVTVKLTDKREFKAKVRGLDKTSDVAVLKIDAADLPTVRLGSSTATRVGEWVLAIGSPFGFENSASAGIVSAKSRSLPDGSYVPFIQTDVAVNPGNSGGPLFNMAGEVIGINSQIYSRSGGYQGLSFAIPIEVAMNVEQQILTSGKVQRGRLGVTIQEVNQSLADSFGLPKPAGALVSAIDKDGPAAKAGLEAGDVILGIDGRELVNSGELPAIVAAMKAGQTTRLKVWRDGKARDVAVTVGSFAEPRQAEADTQAEPKGRLGVAVRPLTPDERRQAEVRDGVLVQDVSGAAARAGIQPGDIILSVNGAPVRDIEQLRHLIEKAGKHVALLIDREDTRLFVPVDLG